MKKILLTLTMLSTLFLVSCQNKDEKTKETKIYVGTNAEFAPFEYLEGDKIVGFDVDLINAISKHMETEIEIKDMSFDALLPALQTKKVDLVIAGMTKTEEREKSVDFSKPYYTSKQVIVTNKDSNIKTFDDLVGKKVGVMLGFTGDTLMTEKEGVKVERFNASYASILALTQNKLDAVVLDFEPAKNYIKNNENLKIVETEAVEEKYVIAVRKTDKELTEKINKALQKVIKSGEYEEILKKYF